MATTSCSATIVLSLRVSEQQPREVSMSLAWIDVVLARLFYVQDHRWAHSRLYSRTCASALAAPVNLGSDAASHTARISLMDGYVYHLVSVWNELAFHMGPPCIFQRCDDEAKHNIAGDAQCWGQGTRTRLRKLIKIQQGLGTPHSRPSDVLCLQQV
jgi:hypothetical protein